MAEADELLGKVLLGSYCVTRLLGKGGMGSVYEAQHLRLPRKVAVKVLHRDAAESEELFARFRQEAEVASSLGHSHICEVTDFSPPDAPFPFIVMEHLDGIDLATHMERVGPLPIKQAIRVAGDVLSALHAAHARDIVHRDLKPQNIFLCRRDNRDDFVKLLDFGISKMRGAGGGLTKPLMLLGTPSYMAPEQVQGKNDLIDGRTDIWAMGVVLYEMLTGKVAFPGHDLMSAVYRVVFEEPTPVKLLRRDAPLVLCEVVARAMAKESTRRYGAASDMAEDLLRAAESTGEWEKEEDTAPELGATARRSPLLPATSTSDAAAGPTDQPRGPAVAVDDGTVRQQGAPAVHPELLAPPVELATTLPRTMSGVGPALVAESSLGPGQPDVVPPPEARPAAVTRPLGRVGLAPTVTAASASNPLAAPPAPADGESPEPTTPPAAAAPPALPATSAAPAAGRRRSISMASGLGAVTTTTMRGLIRSRWRLVTPVVLVLLFAGLGGVTATYFLSTQARPPSVVAPAGGHGPAVTDAGGGAGGPPIGDVAGPGRLASSGATGAAQPPATAPAMARPRSGASTEARPAPASAPAPLRAALGAPPPRAPQGSAKQPPVAAKTLAPPTKTTGGVPADGIRHAAPAPAQAAPAAGKAPPAGAKAPPPAAKAPPPAAKAPPPAAKAPLRIRRTLGEQPEPAPKSKPEIRIKRDLQ